MLELELLIYQNAQYPSLGMSLRIEARVESLPLSSFFASSIGLIYVVREVLNITPEQKGRINFYP